MSKTLTIKIPEELHRVFKIKMAVDNKTMQDRVVELIEGDARLFEEFKNERSSLRK